MGDEQHPHVLFCCHSCFHRKGLKLEESVFTVGMIEETADDTGTIVRFHNFTISGLVCRSKPSNNHSDSVRVSPRRKRLIFHTVRVERGSETQDFLFRAHPSPCLRPTSWKLGKVSVTSYCPFPNIHNSAPETITILLCKSQTRGGEEGVLKKSLWEPLSEMQTREVSGL